MIGPSRRNILVLGLTLLLVAGALTWVGARWAKSSAEHAADLAAVQTGRVHYGLLASELQKFRLLPLVLAEYPDVATILETSDPAAEQRLDAKLEQLAQRTNAAAIYVIDAGGRTRVASNWRLPTSFVGQNYAFRPYFRDAMHDGSSELFALGTVSGLPGLYLARRVDRGQRKLGTIVVKVDFDRVEADWARGPGISFVTDAHGVVLIPSNPDWRFGATSPLDARTLSDARRSLQFGSDPPRRLPVSLSDRAATTETNGLVQQYRVASMAAPLAGSRLYHLSPLQPPLAAAQTEALLWALGIVSLIGALGAAFLRQTEKQRLLRESREQLEKEVDRQTAELRDTNARLIVESQEREEANARFHAAREELARANRLGTLGQITAGVAHEINQPVAAIRTFAENSALMLETDQPGPIRDNLSRIVSLTDRIGAITAELRSFTRRKIPTPIHAELGSILDGAMLLIGEDARGKVEIAANRNHRGRMLVGDRVRVEQILINLLRNALDAVEDRPDPKIRIVSTESKEGMSILVSDNGPGVDAAVRETLFDPFETAKPGGLGLGLAIARDIAREFGGDLVLKSSDASGARFLLTLRIAT